MEHTDLIGLADFVLVARHGGIGKASRATGRPKATLSRRIADLEASMALRLFERGARDLKLTEEGRALFERAGTLLTELDETARGISTGGHMPRGRLRISAPVLFSHLTMGRLASEFVRKFPDIQLDVTTEDRPVDMVEEAYDLVIRVNPEPDESLVGRIFLRDRLVVVASPDVKQPADDETVPAVIRGKVAENQTWEMQTTSGPTMLSVRPVLGFSSLLSVRDAVGNGAGVARLPLSLVQNDLTAGTLVQWGETSEPETALWALYPSRRLLSTRVSAFLDHLKAAFPQGTPEELSAYLD